MPGVVQHALGVLWNLFQMFAALGFTYMITDAQHDFRQFLAAWFALFSFYVLWLLPHSNSATFLFNIWYQTPPYLLVCAALIVFTVFLYQAVNLGDPSGMKYLLTLGMMLLCTIERAHRRAMGPGPLPLLLGAPPQPDAVAGEADDPEETTMDSANEANFPSATDHHAEPKQSDSPAPSAASSALVLVPVCAHRSCGPAATAQPWIWYWARSAARKAISFIWRLFVFVFFLGLATLFVHALLDMTFRELVGNPVPMDRAPRFETAPIIQPKLPIDVPFVTAFTTSDVIPPTASPTPTPVARRTWRVAATSTPMPTPMPTSTAAPEPSPQPEAARVVFSVEPLEVLPGLLSFDLPDPTSVLEWYFGLPRQSQHLYIALTLLLCWFFSGLLMELIAALAVLVAAYLITVAIIALLLIYQFTPEQSLAIALKTNLALVAIIWYARLWLKSLASKAWTHAAGLADISSKFEDFRSRTDLTTGGMMNSFWAAKAVLDAVARKAKRTISRVRRLNKATKKHGEGIRSLSSELGRIRKQLIVLIIRRGLVRGLNKRDHKLLLRVRDQVNGIENIRKTKKASKADEAELKVIQGDLHILRDRLNELPYTEVKKPAVNKLSKQIESLIRSLADVQRIQSEIVACSKKLENRVDAAQAEILFLHDASLGHDESISRIETNAVEARNDMTKLQTLVNDNHEESDAKISKLEKKIEDSELENADLRKGLSDCLGKVEDMQKKMGAEVAGQVKREDLQQVREEAASTADQMVKQLRSETHVQHGQVMQAHSDLEASVDKRIAAETDAREAFQKESKSRHNGMREDIGAMDRATDDKFKSASAQLQGVTARLDTISTTINTASQTSTQALELVKAVKEQGTGSVDEIHVNEHIWRLVHRYMENFMVSDTFRAAVKDAQLTVKQQSKLDQVRAGVRAYAEKRLESKEFQDQICAYIIERQALDNNLSGDPAEVISEGRTSSPGIGPSDSDPADDNTIGNEDPPGDPPGVISGGQATLPGGMSSDDNTTSTTPEDCTTPDAGDHHGTRGAPHGEPPGGYPGGHAGGLGGSTSDGSSGDGGGAEPRPSGEDSDDDDTPRPKQWKGKGPAEPDNLTYEQLYGPATLEQPGGEQVEDTEEEETDDENDDDDDAHDGDDGHESDDDGPPGPPPENDGSHGDSGAGGNDGDDDDQDGDDDGAPGPSPRTVASNHPSGLAISRHAPGPSPDPGDPSPPRGIAGSRFAPGGLANSRYAPGPSPGPPPSPVASNHPSGLAISRFAPGPSPGPSTPSRAPGLSSSRFDPGPSTGSLSPQGPGSADGDPGDAQEANDDGSEHLPASKPKHNAAQNLRASMDSNNKAQVALKSAIVKLQKEKAEQQQMQPWATRPSNQPTPAQLERRTMRERLRNANNMLSGSLTRFVGEHSRLEQEQARLEQAGGQPESAKVAALERLKQQRQRMRDAHIRLEQGKELVAQTSERPPRPEGWVPPPGPHKKHRRGKRGKGGKGNGGGGAGGNGPGP